MAMNESRAAVPPTLRIERLLKLIRALESGPARSADELAELADVSRRTIFRDLDLLARAGLRYTFDRETQRYSRTRSMLLPPATFSHAEALALLLAAHHRSPEHAPTEDATTASARLKLASTLPPALQDYCGPLLDQVELRLDPVSDTGSILETVFALQAAVLKTAKVRATYDSYYDGKVIHLVLHPRRIAFVHRAWYLIAYAEEFSEVRTFKVERFLRLRVLEEHATDDPEFKLDDYFGNAWMMIREDEPYHVVVRFSKRVAGNVDEILWHKTQRTKYEGDGALLFEVDVDGIREISWWILGYGDEAEVLEPPKLRSLIAQRVARMHKCYNARSKQTVSRV